MRTEGVSGPQDVALAPGLRARDAGMAERGDELWDALLRWLGDKHGMDVGLSGLLVERRDAEGAGKGLFAVQSCPPSATLFTIPASAMINLRTLSPLYPAAGKLLLTANQMIPLHLVLHRPGEDGISRDPSWGPFISTMPRGFGSHPVTWAVRKRLGLATVLEEDLLSLLPPTTASAVNDRVRPFMADMKAICEYAIAKPEAVSKTSRDGLMSSDFRPDNHALAEDCLWAWLNVNTRCIYYQLDPTPSAPKNLTLCPILDLANHRPDDTHIIPVLPSSIFPSVPGSSHKARRGLGGDYMFIASSEKPIQTDDELFLRYGSHSNQVLFVEYGFVNLWKEGACQKGKFNGEVDVQDAVEELVSAKGSTGEVLKEILEEEGYWGDWTMHSQPAPAHPSYRLISALRLLQAVPDGAQGDTFDHAVEHWRTVLWGQADQISEENEKAWRSMLLEICQHITRKAKTEVQSVQQRAHKSRSEDPSWTEWMLKNIEMLWREEYEVGEAVAESIRAGVDF